MSSSASAPGIPIRTSSWDKVSASERQSLAWSVLTEEGTNLVQNMTKDVRTSWAIVVTVPPAGSGSELSFLHTGKDGAERIVIASKRKNAEKRQILFCPHADRTAFLPSRVSLASLGKCGFERRGNAGLSAVANTFVDATKCRLHALRKHPEAVVL